MSLLTLLSLSNTEQSTNMQYFQHLMPTKIFRLFNSPVIFQILTNKIADIYFRSLAIENSSEYSTIVHFLMQ
jgi:hypothetical protein